MAGVQIAHHGLVAPYTGSSTDEVSLEPLSFSISGVGRRLEANSEGPTNTLGVQANFNSQEDVTGWGVSSSPFLPILPPKNGASANTAHVVMEGVTGSGIAAFFHGLSWGVQPRLRMFCHQQWIRRR